MNPTFEQMVSDLEAAGDKLRPGPHKPYANSLWDTFGSRWNRSSPSG
jgi:hypothetical protein